MRLQHRSHFFLPIVIRDIYKAWIFQMQVHESPRVFPRILPRHVSLISRRYTREKLSVRYTWSIFLGSIIVSTGQKFWTSRRRRSSKKRAVGVYDDAENLRSLVRVWMSLTNFSKPPPPPPPPRRTEVNRRRVDSIKDLQLAHAFGEES